MKILEVVMRFFKRLFGIWGEREKRRRAVPVKPPSPPPPRKPPERPPEEPPKPPPPKPSPPAPIKVPRHLSVNQIWHYPQVQVAEIKGVIEMDEEYWEEPETNEMESYEIEQQKWLESQGAEAEAEAENAEAEAEES